LEITNFKHDFLNTFQISKKKADDIMKVLFQKKEYLINNLEKKLKLKNLFKDKIVNQNKLADIKIKLNTLYSQKFNNDNSHHTIMLFQIWKQLKGDNNIQLHDKKWLEIGFQGPDPTTDFRGAGMMALINLHDFVIKRFLSSEKVYLDATDIKKWYFFAASGVNISGAIIDIIEVKLNFINIKK